MHTTEKQQESLQTGQVTETRQKKRTREPGGAVKVNQQGQAWMMPSVLTKAGSVVIILPLLFLPAGEMVPKGSFPARSPQKWDACGGISGTAESLGQGWGGKGLFWDEDLWLR